MKLLLTIALPLYMLDQITKWLVVQNFPLHSHKTIIPGFFELVHVTNTGAAFGSFSDSNAFFMILSFLVGAVMLYLFLKGSFKEPLSRLGAVLLLSGIAGNLTDRIVHGHVIDFLSFDLHVPFANPWPSFNVADSCICVAAGLFLLQSVLEGKRPAPSHPGPGGRP
jgi:signal peptidase II